jgi:hypothetical protein
VNITSFVFCHLQHGEIINVQNLVDFKSTELWIVIHITAAILCACLPVYKPLRQSFSTASGSIYKFFSSSKQYIGTSLWRSSRKPQASYPLGSVGVDNQIPPLYKSASQLQGSARDLLDGTPSS